MIAPIDLTGAESTRTLHRRWQERASVGSGAGAPRESSAQAVQPVVSAPVLILALIVLGMGIGWVAQLIMGRGTSQIDWTMALVAGTLGSFVGGLLFSLLAGDGLAVKPSGVIGSLIGALIVTAVWQAVAKKQRADARVADKKPWEK